MSQTYCQENDQSTGEIRNQFDELNNDDTLENQEKEQKEQEKEQKEQKK